MNGRDKQDILNQMFNYVFSSNSDNSPTAIKLETGSTTVGLGNIIHRKYEKSVNLCDDSVAHRKEFIGYLNELLAVNHNTNYFKLDEANDFSDDRAPIVISVLNENKVLFKYSITNIEEGTSLFGGYHFHRSKIKKTLISFEQKLPLSSSFKKAIKTKLKSIDDYLQECIEHPFYVNIVVNPVMNY